MSARARAGGSARRLLAALAPLPFVACSADSLVTLGRAVPDPQFGDEGRPVAGLNDDSDQSAPSLTEDLLEIHFTSIGEGSGKGDIWRAQRSTRVAAFDKAEFVNAVSTTAQEVSPVVSRDGLTLWIGSDRDGGLGGLDIWQAERGSRSNDWGPLRNVTELNSPSDDIPRPLAQGERVMPLVSWRGGGEGQLYLAHRSSLDGAFGELALLELPRADGGGIGGGFLTEDGRLLLFHREGSGGGDLYLAWRRSAREPFQNVLELAGVNTPGAFERDPWISADQTRFFFASSRLTGRGLDIFGTTLDLPVFE